MLRLVSLNLVSDTKRGGIDHSGGGLITPATEGAEMSDGQAFGVAVPAVAHETYRWHPSHPEHYSKSEVRRQTGEYRAAVTAAIERWNPSIGAEITADLDEATQALVAFDQYARVRLGADNPTLGPMAAILLRTESASSSQIELLTTSARQLALAEIGEGRKRHALTVIGNVRAMESAIRLSDELSVGTILSMHRELLSRQYGMDEHAGRFRDQLVWIGNRDSAGPLGASFIAPQASLVPPAVDDLVRFMGRDDLPALLQTAVAHAQFETIHPFADGNGRTGRALAQALLRNKRLAAHTTVPISAGLSQMSNATSMRSQPIGQVMRRRSSESLRTRRGSPRLPVRALLIPLLPNWIGHRSC